jgi:hypothetical protein
MNSKITIAFVILAMMIGVSGVTAQTHFTFTSKTGSNAVVVIPNTASPSIADIPLSSGDEIGAFSPAGLCVGACVWDGNTTSITVWANDPMTDAIDGMIGGQVISYHIWNASSGVEYPFVDVSYGSGIGISSDGIFQPNTNFVLTSIRATGVLPVELVSFKASGTLHGIALAWATATEVNNYGFEIERSSFKSDRWQKIGFVEGAGSTNAPRSYAYTDRNVPAGKYSYRLKQIDRDGKFEYSPEATAAAVSVPNVFALSQNYPNPFNPATTIAFDLPRETYTRLVVYNALGQEVATLVKAVLGAGHQSVQFDASQLPGGVYLYRLEAGTSSMVKKMTLLK